MLPEGCNLRVQCNGEDGVRIDIADCVVGAPVKNFALLFFPYGTHHKREKGRPLFPYSEYNFEGGGVHRKVVRSRVHNEARLTQCIAMATS
jgi:hypothetical protein